MRENNLKVLYLSIHSPTHISVLNEGSAAPMTSFLLSPSSTQSNKEGLGLWKTRGPLSDPEHPILSCSDSKESSGKNKGWDEAADIPGDTSECTEEKAGTVMERHNQSLCS